MFQYISCCYLSRKLYPDTPAVFVFQYISYCYLSVILKRKHRQEISFNTSHVVIYRKTDQVVPLRAEFQYISCCYLSWHRAQAWNSQWTFQYISCCYLSNFCFLCFFCRLVSIHLMLLFIKPFFSTAKRLFQISIHLMLLFIFIASALSHLGF